MYQLVKAVLRSKTPYSGYENVDLTGVTVNSVQATYRDGYLELTTPSIVGSIFVNLLDIYRLSVSFPNIIFTAFLNNISVSIPHSEIEPVVQTELLVGYDAMAHTQVDLFPEIDLIEISNINGAKEYNTHLVHVNGRFRIHEWDSVKRKIKIKQNHREPMNNDSIGLVRGQRDVPIQIIPLKDAMKINDALVMPLPSMENKTAIVFLGGFPMIGKNITPIGQGRMAFIRLDQISLADIFLRMSRYENIPEVQLPTIPDHHVAEIKTRTPAAYERLKNDPGSFIAIFDGYDFTTIRDFPMMTYGTNRFETTMPPNGIILDPYGFPVSGLIKQKALLDSTVYQVFVNKAAIYTAHAYKTEPSDGTQILTEQSLPDDNYVVEPKVQQWILQKNVLV